MTVRREPARLGRHVISLVAAAAIASGMAADDSAARPGPTSGFGSAPAAEQILVKLRSGAEQAGAESTLRRSGGTVRGRIAKLGVIVAGAPARNRGAVLAALRRLPEVEYAEPDVPVTAFDTIPNDVRWSEQWGPRKIGAPRAWDTTRGSTAVTVAVLDTGVDPTHPDLLGAVAPGYDFVNGDSVPADDEGHGTAAAGVTGARTDNLEGIAGTCWSCTLMPVKVLDANGSGTDGTLAAGIVWAVDHGADILNMSLGGSGQTQTLANAVAYATARNVILVAAAGNSSVSTPSYPAAYESVIAVAGSDDSDQLYSWSNFGAWVDLAAPGCNIAPVEGAYGHFCGTSSAAPVVSGVAGLALSVKPTATKSEVDQTLRVTATPVPGIASGRVNAASVVSVLAPPPVAPPPVAPPPVAPPPVAPPAVAPAIAAPAISAGERFQRSRTFSVAWAGANAASYDVRYRAARAGGGFGTYVAWATATPATRGTFSGSPGSTYCFSAKANGPSGAVSPWSAEACTAVPLNDRALTRSGGWRERFATTAYLGDYASSSARGATLRRTGLHARRLALVVSTCPGCGTVDVLWNGQRLKRISLYSSVARTRRVVAIQPFGAVRTGTVTIRVVTSRKPVKIEGLGVSKT